ncbi:nuclear transport factor 2 family protein [Sphingomonas sp.]|uniref:nuclear transport factor 2 family protein n=1 Tax=Sphingomonas sp. TaxID=28214 RepID=UPI001EB38B27|nr:nuclear transport factor 2 family protein [Sphingomonas sp.]MBX3594712.1 nuclear transport factor 2 family protein [Sphingomonas sp.]
MADPAKMIEAVHAYVAAFACADAERIVALFADDATVEDPVGTAPLRGTDAIRTFYRRAVGLHIRLALDGPIRLTDDHAAFPFSIRLRRADGWRMIDAIDTFRFDGANRIVEMRAFWGAANERAIAENQA